MRCAYKYWFIKELRELQGTPETPQNPYLGTARPRPGPGVETSCEQRVSRDDQLSKPVVMGILHLDRYGVKFVFPYQPDDFRRTVIGHEEVGACLCQHLDILAGSMSLWAYRRVPASFPVEAV